MQHLMKIMVTLLLTLPMGALAEQRRNIDLVIALDVSGSMSGLIDSAKQRLWDVVNTFNRTQPRPLLRVAIVSFGNPHYGQDTGFVRIDQDLTTDLDRVNETLFGFVTNGGSEYVARAVATSLERLNWSPATDAMRVLFVAGNESTSQDPVLSLDNVLANANERNITVNAIYCGSEQDAIAPGWRHIAQRTQGTFASINQAINAVAHVETPVDEKLAELGRALNETYIPFGAEGEDARQRQARQDDNAGQMSLGALASRVITKASELYKNAQWDLVDAFEQGEPLGEIAPEALPPALRNAPLEELEQTVAEQSARRAQL